MPYLVLNYWLSYGEKLAFITLCTTVQWDGVQAKAHCQQGLTIVILGLSIGRLLLSGLQQNMICVAVKFVCVLFHSFGDARSTTATSSSSHTLVTEQCTSIHSTLTPPSRKLK